MSTSKAVNLGEMARWHCANCGKWNAIERGLCSCGAAQVNAADAFKLNNTLTTEEDCFYKMQVPEILCELRNIRLLLAKMLQQKEVEGEQTDK
jgi:hypothetical protein